MGGSEIGEHADHELRTATLEQRPDEEQVGRRDATTRQRLQLAVLSARVEAALDTERHHSHLFCRQPIQTHHLRAHRLGVHQHPARRSRGAAREHAPPPALAEAELLAQSLERQIVERHHSGCARSRRQAVAGREQDIDARGSHESGQHRLLVPDDALGRGRRWQGGVEARVLQEL